VAACCSNASSRSRVRRAISISGVVVAERLPGAALGRVRRRFTVAALPRTDFLAFECWVISFPFARTVILAAPVTVWEVAVVIAPLRVGSRTFHACPPCLVLGGIGSGASASLSLGDSGLRQQALAERASAHRLSIFKLETTCARLRDAALASPAYRSGVHNDPRASGASDCRKSYPICLRVVWPPHRTCRRSEPPFPPSIFVFSAPRRFLRRIPRDSRLRQSRYRGSR
jgi:hypothetical protein